jgi:hypothetical protein
MQTISPQPICVSRWLTDLTQAIPKAVCNKVGRAQHGGMNAYCGDLNQRRFTELVRPVI